MQRLPTPAHSSQASAAVTDMATYYIQKLGAFVGNDDEKNFIWTS
jgi:hypothetical protein